MAVADANPGPTLSRDIWPLLLVPALAAIALPFIGLGPTWVTLTVAGLAIVLVICALASVIAIRVALRVDPAEAIG